jgi:transcriptional regulator GlxA family with amidase domain
MRHVMGDFVNGRAVFADAVMAASLEDALACELLLQHPHSFSQRLNRRGGGISPRDMHRAIEFIDANLDTAITIEDLARATGVAGRSLFRHFQHARGVSPLRYIRDLRFQKARQALLRAPPEGSVTAVALSCGFSHLGRFAGEYRKRFGETPSETLRRRPQP